MEESSRRSFHQSSNSSCFSTNSSLATITSSSNLAIVSSSPGPRNVVIIFDVSKEVSPSVLEWTVERILHPGDVLTLLGILHEVLTPMGYKSRVDFASFNGVNLKCLEEEEAKTVKYYNMRSMELQSICSKQKVKLEVKVAKGHPLDVIATQEAKKLKASWVILDRNVRTYRKNIQEQLSCNVVLMSRNNEGKVLKVCEPIVLYPSLQFNEITSDSEAGKTDREETVDNNNKQADELCFACESQETGFYMPRSFSYSELEEATQSFSPRNFIAQGGFGPVYKGILEDGQHIAVKQNKVESSQGEKEFRAEIEVLSGAQHKNLVRLLGFCIEGGKRMLVYEFVCNKSLDWHLSDTKKVLPWSARHTIAMGAARGLRYLHEECRTGCIVHRDVRPHNILLTHDYTPKVGDFGLARWAPEDSTLLTRLVGTLGYLAPEYVTSGEVTTKTDVYSFGVVLLELITGRRAIVPSLPEEEKSLTQWARPKLENRDAEALIDRRLGEDFDVYELHCMIHAATFCLQSVPSRRARMTQIVRILGED